MQNSTKGPSKTRARLKRRTSLAKSGRRECRVKLQDFKIEKTIGSTLLFEEFYKIEH